MTQRFYRCLPIFLLIAFFAQPAMATSSSATPSSGLEVTMMTVSFKLVLTGLGLVAFLVLVAMFLPKKNELLKRIVFSSIIVAVVVPTIVLIYNTVTLNLNSWSNGPVHWHADYEVWACGRKLDLVDPTGWSNKIGTPTLHEHNDDRIHVEGVALTPYEVSLGRYFTVIGGKLSQNALTFPDKDGLVNHANNSLCGDGSTGVVQVYVYRAKPDGTYSQIKVQAPENYTLSPQSQVPPGDCIIVEFGPDSPTTNRLCQSWQAALTTGKLKNSTPPEPTQTPLPVEVP